ncbi:tape measure protein [Kiritimatiellota bacterium B12222]|nr:tape measure protein [Kiritimatiellota bacterium B12222]
MSKDLRFNILVKENFDKAMGNGKRAMRGLLHFSGGIAKSIRATFRGLFDFRTILAGGGLLGGFGVSVKKAFDVETVQTQLKVALGNAKEAKKIYKEMVSFSDSTNFDADEVTKLGTSLIATGSAAGDVIDEIKMLGDIAAGTSTPLNELGNVLIKIRGKGKLQGDTMDMFMERGIPIVKALSKELGIAESEVADFVSSGQVGFPVVISALKSMTSEGGQFHNMMKELSTQGNGLISTLNGKWSSALADFGSHFSELSKGAIQGLIDRLDTLRNDGSIERWAANGAKAAKVLANVMGDIFSGDQAERSKALGDMGKVVKAMFMDAGSAFMNVVEPRFLALMDDLWSKIPKKGEVVKSILKTNVDFFTGKTVYDAGKSALGIGKKAKEVTSEFKENDTGRTKRILSELSGGRHESIAQNEQDRIAKEAGKKLGMWLRDPSLMVKDGADIAGLSGFIPKNGTGGAQSHVASNVLGGNQVSLSEIFSRMQDNGSMKTLGSINNPTHVRVVDPVSVTELKSEET